MLLGAGGLWVVLGPILPCLTPAIKVVSRDELLEGVWEYQPGVSSRTVDVHVAWLRQKLEDEPQAPRHIHTVRGVGYRFSYNGRLRRLAPGPPGNPPGLGPPPGLPGPSKPPICVNFACCVGVRIA